MISINESIDIKFENREIGFNSVSEEFENNKIMNLDLAETTQSEIQF